MNDLNYCYHHSDFKFSAEAEKWIRDTYYYPYLNKFVAYDKYSTANSEKNILNKKITWQDTVALEELRGYLSTWGIAHNYIGTERARPDVFISNSQEHAQPGWPHIDGHKWKENDPSSRLPVLTRFNVVIEYNPDDPMHWWEHVTHNHPMVGNDHQYLAIRGSNHREKLDNLGPPTMTKTELYKNHCAAFLRTDCAHCLDIKNPGFRLVISLALDCTLEELYQRRGLL